MSRIRGTDTVPERIVRSCLHGMGFRFSTHEKGLPGKPDIVLAKYRTVVFVHGCFWHRHEHCVLAYTPKSRIEFWSKKFLNNVERDFRAKAQLESMGWRVLVVWECMTLDKDACVAQLRQYLLNGSEKTVNSTPA